jgi:predicted component of type VI protein secretion system
MVGDYEFTHEPTDVQLMRALAKIAGQRAHAAVRRGAAPT